MLVKKWDDITMDFVINLPNTTCGYDFIGVVVDQLTKFAWFILIKEMFSVDRLADVYIK